MNDSEDEPYDDGEYSQDDEYGQDDYLYGGEYVRENEYSGNENLSDTWEDFKTSLIDQWDELWNDPIEFASQYWDMFCDNKKTIFAVLLAIIMFTFFARGGSSTQESLQTLAQERFTKLSRAIKIMIDEEKDIPLSTKTNLRRSFVYASRRLAGLDDSTKKQPIVLLFATHSRDSIHLLAQKFVRALSKYPEITVIDFDCDASINRMDFEKQIFSRLQDTASKHRLLILNNIDHLSDTAPLVLHSLADNESSPFKDIVIIATIQLNELTDKSIDSNSCNSLISSYLLKTWSSENLSIDQIHPIISRLSGAPICYK